MKRLDDPGCMTSEERLLELGALLATGVRRMLLSSKKVLAESAQSERSCDRTVDAPDDPGQQEVA